MADFNQQDSFPKPNDDFVAGNPFVSPIAEEARGEGYVTRTGEPLNPWISMWTRARATVRQQLETDPTKHVLLLAIIAGMAGQLANNASAISEQISLRMASFAGLLMVGAISGLIWLYVGGWLIGMAGRSLGGVANAFECRTALAWSTVPAIWMAPLNLAIGLYFIAAGPKAILGSLPDEGPIGPFAMYAAMPPWMLAIMGIGMIVGLWQLVLMCQSVGEAHQFSSLRGFGALLLAGLALMGLMLVILIPLGFLFFAVASNV